MRPRPDTPPSESRSPAWALALLAVLGVVHLAAAWSIVRQPFGAPPAEAPLRFLFNDGTHRMGPGADFMALYGAGAAARAGQDVYGRIPDDAGVPYAFPYRYSPVVASSLGAALSMLSPRAAFVLWCALLELLLLACLRVWWRYTAGGLQWFGACALLLSTPFLLELQMGQFTFAATACAFIALLLAWERPLVAPLALAAGAFLKTFPLVAVPALLRRRPEPFVVFSAFTLLLGADAAQRPDAWRTFLQLNFGATHLAPTSDAGNYGALHAAAQWGRALEALPFGPAEVDAAAWWLRIGALALACAVVLRVRKRPHGTETAGAALLLGHFVSYAHVWEHHYAGVLLAGLLVTRAAHGLRRPVVTGVAVVCVLLMTAPTPFWLWDTAHDPRVWDPAARWTPLQCALLPTFKAGPALTLYALTLGLAVVGPRRALGSPHGTDAPRGSGPSASSEGGLVQVHQPQVGGLELPQADAELG